MRETTENVTTHIISSIDQKLWDAIAVKVIKKMAPHKITKESVHMFNDFTKLTTVEQKTSGTSIRDIHQSLSKFKENYIVGTSKMIERTIRSCSQKNSEKSPVPFLDHMRSTKHRHFKTEKHEQTIDHHEKEKKKINNFFKLTLQDHHNEEEEKVDEAFRNSKAFDLEYSKKIEETKKELQEMRQRRTATQEKKFKEMKIFTYDFEGRLLSRGLQKQEGTHKVINMQPEFTEQLKLNKMVQSRKTSKGSQIVDKKVIYYEKPSLMDQAKQKRQVELQVQKTQRRNSFMKNVSLNKFQNIFTKETRMAIGVSITDTENRSRVAGSERDRSDKKNLKLLEYRDQAKMTEYFPTRKNLKIRTITEGYRTEVDESITKQRLRIKTQGNQISSKMSASFRKLRPGKGIIHINHQKLYRQNFSPLPLEE